MLKRLFAIPLAAVIPAIVPLVAPTGDAVPGRVQVGQVALPELSSQEWKTIVRREGSDHQPLHIDVDLSVYYGRVWNVSVRNGTGYPEIDRAIVHWIASNWKLAPWFAGHNDYVVSLDVDPVLRQVVFRKSALGFGQAG
jgi:type IV secretory pathway TrbD component